MHEIRVKAMMELLPDGGWICRDGVFEAVDDGIVLPSEEEIDAKVSQIETNEPIIQELMYLDYFIPRALEDIILKDGSDSFLVGKANEKKILRSKLK